jgi:ABC-type transporter Mla MlaB component
MLRITKIQESPRAVHLMLEGKVAEQWAALLDGVCRAHLRDHKIVQLDCEHVDFVDASGVDVLKNFPRRQVKLVRAPGFITQLLKNADHS